MGVKTELLLEDHFTPESVDGSRFANVSRATGVSGTYDIKLGVDVNTSIYPLSVHKSYAFCFHQSDEIRYTAAENFDLDRLTVDWDYVCYGRVFKIENSGENQRTVYISFSGLLCYLQSQASLLSNFHENLRVLFMLKQN